MALDDAINQFTEDLSFEALEDWCAILSVDYETPPLDDMWPDWESELRQEIAEAMLKVGKKTGPFDGKEKNPMPLGGE